MLSMDVIKRVLKERNLSQLFLAEKLGAKSQAVISMTLKRGNSVKTETFVNMLELLDCELIVRSKLKDKTEWIVDNNAEPMPKKLKPGTMVTSDGYVLTQNDIDMVMAIVNKMKGEAK